MATAQYVQGLPICPICGGPMQAKPSLDGSGWVAVCPRCPNAPLISLPAPPPPLDERELATARFRKLTTHPLPTPVAGTWPESLLEDLPPEARDLLRRRPPSSQAKGTAQLREELANTLRDQGYVISEDARGIRISGGRLSPRPGSGQLSASDVIRLASEMDGGAPPPERRTRCPKCDAVVRVDAARCPWCGQVLSPSNPES